MPGQHHVHFSDSAVDEKEESLPSKFIGLPEEMAMLKFPKVKNILWDHDSTGDDVHLSLSYYRKPQLCVTEKVLRFAQRHLESSQCNSCSYALQGSIAVDQDGEGVTFVLDRFDPGGGGTISCSGLTPGDISVPFEMFGNTKENRHGSQSDYFNALKLLQQKTGGKESIELSNFLLAKGWCSFYTHGEKSVHHIDFDVVTLATEFRVTPIPVVPIVPTALSKNLSGPMSLSHLQGEPKTGYLTMDHTRKVLLVLESDPKVFNLPLVGIWISGVSYIYSPFVWASCIRYLFNSSINDRVCAIPEPFLLVLYSPLHSKPEFYDVTIQNSDGKLQFDLYTGYEVVSLPRTITNSSQHSVEIELSSAKPGNKRETFDAALHEFDLLRPGLKSETVEVPVSAAAELEEMTPRSRPAPYTLQVPKAVPMVPEVSLIFGDENSGILTESGPRQPLIMHGKPSGVHHVQDFLSSTQQPLKYQQSSHNSVPGNHKLLSHAQSAPNLQQIRPAKQQQQCKLPCCASNKMMQNGRLAQNYLSNATPQPNRVQNGMNAFPQPSNTKHRRSMTTIPQGHNGYPLQQAYPHPLSTSAPYRPGPPPSSGPVYKGPSFPPHDLRHSCSCPDCLYHLPVQNGHVRHPTPKQNYGIPSSLGETNQHGKTVNSRVSFPKAPAVRGPLPECTPKPQYSQAFPVMSQSNQSQNAQPSSYPHQMYYAENPQIVQQAVQEIATTQPQMNPVITKVQETIPPPPQDSALSPRSTAEARNSQTDSSGRSSDDSGFSVTPEKKVSNSVEDIAGFQTAAFGNGINWNQVPQEVYQLLMHQDAQLKQLQAQIQTLINNQSVSTQHTTMTELNSTTGKSSVENQSGVSQPVMKCEMGTNTTVFNPTDKNSIALQTSPVKSVSQPQNPVEPLWNRSQEYPDNVRSHEYPDSARSQDYQDSARSQEYPDSARSQEYPDSARSREAPDSARSNRSSPLQPNGQMTDRSSHSSHCSQTSQEGSNYEPRTPAEIRHRGVLPMNSTEREDFDLNMSQGEMYNVVNNVALHNKTMDSMHSDMIVDMPSYHSSPSRSQVSPDSGSGEISQSPISASMCGDQQHYSGDSEDEEEGQGQLSADNKEYYDKLMENIHKLLQHQDSGLTGDLTADTLERDTLQQSVMLGQYLNSMRIGGGQNPVETTFIPKINYMSMMFESDSDCSMEINAMAMKYLKDEQLTQLNKLQTQSRLKGNKDNHKANLLRQVLSEGRDTTPDVTTMGMSPNDMTFATRKYLEKYGLVNDSESTRSGNTSESTGNDTYELKVNFSTVNSPVNSPQRTVPDSYHTPLSRKSRSPFLDSLRSQNKTGSPYQNTSGSPFVNSVQTSSSRCVNNGTVSDRIGSPYTNSHNGSTRTQSSRREVMDSPRGQVQSRSNSYGIEDSAMRTPVRGFSNSYDNDSQDITPKATPNQRLQPVLRPTFTPSPNQGERPRMLSPIAQEEPAENNVQASTHLQSEHDDKVLDITRLKMMPKLL